MKKAVAEGAGAGIHEAGIAELDELFAHAGLTRSRRENPAGITTRLRRDRMTAEELKTDPPATYRTVNGMELVRAAAWQSGSTSSWLWHGFSTRIGGVSRAYCAEDATGDLNLGFTAADQRETVLGNRRLLAQAVSGSPDTPLTAVRQFHSNLVVAAGAGSAGQANPPKADGVITDEPGMLLAVMTADCVPVLVADRKRKVVAAFHAGWRGTVKRIVETGIGRMRLEFGCKPEDLTAAIGPAIGVCCYGVGEEVFSEFESQFSYAEALFRKVDDADEVRRKYPMLFLTQRAPGHSPIGPSLHIDLVEANRRQLRDAGLSAKAIHTTGGCTSCHRHLFFSHRASQGHAGRMMSVIGIRPKRSGR